MVEKLKFLRLFYSLALLPLLSLFACSHNEKEENAPKGNAVYYWRTAFQLSDIEREFLKENEIKAIYVKFFDIVARGENIRPEATLLFHEKFPEDVEIIPTVFIDSKAFASTTIPENMAEMIVARVDSMMVKNGYEISSEIQIDFDWTLTNRDQYFKLLGNISKKLHEQFRTLSTTIRLHQLNQPPPPADYGALMVYNTGDFSSPKERNSILSLNAVEPYLNKLGGYELPLVTALPIYSWNLIFHDDKFVVIARGVNFQDSTWFASINDNIYRARKYGALPSYTREGTAGTRVMPGDILRHEEADYALLDSVASAIEKTRPGMLGRVILYHLDDQSILKYSKDEIHKIYNRN